MMTILAFCPMLYLHLSNNMAHLMLINKSISKIRVTSCLKVTMFS